MRHHVNSRHCRRWATRKPLSITLLPHQGVSVLRKNGFRYELFLTECNGIITSQPASAIQVSKILHRVLSQDTCSSSGTGENSSASFLFTLDERNWGKIASISFLQDWCIKIWTRVLNIFWQSRVTFRIATVKWLNFTRILFNDLIHFIYHEFLLVLSPPSILRKWLRISTLRVSHFSFHLWMPKSIPTWSLCVSSLPGKDPFLVLFRMKRIYPEFSLVFPCVFLCLIL
jgi:hypothetical protein